MKYYSQMTNLYQGSINRYVDGDTSFAYKLLFPAVAAMVIVHFIPILWGILISFLGLDASTITNWTGAPFIFLENYQEVYDPKTSMGRDFYYSAKQTVVFSAVSIIGSLSLGLITALLLDKFSNSRFGISARTLVLIPWLAPVIVTYYSWRMLFTSETGVVNYGLMNVGIINDQILWLVGDNALWAMVIVNIWRNFPVVAILLYAALQSISSELYQAASIDGAGRWAKFRYVTVPHLRSVASIVILLLTLWSLINFTLPFVLLGRAPPEAGRVLMIFIYNYAFQTYEFGIGAAMSVGLFAIAMIFTMIYFTQIINQQLEGTS